MEPLSPPKGGEKGSSQAVQDVAVETRESSSYRDEPPQNVRPNMQTRTTSTATQQYRVYKRRWAGLIQLVLLNIIISWDWLTFSAVSTTSAEYFNVSESAINWLSTAFLFAFVVISPAVIWTLNRGPKVAIIVASILTFVGNWIRYAGTRASGGHFGVVMFGQIIIGLAQPFVLSAPTRYSDLWFTEKGRISATAVASLANPLGGALGQLVGPFWATSPSQVPNLVLYTAVISTCASVPSFLIPSAPPTPPSASSSIPKTPLRATFRALSRNPSFYLILLPFAVYVGLFNAMSSLLNQILGPYGYSEDQAGICGALLIVIGLLTSAVTSPIIDRTHAYLLSIKILVPVIAASYLCFIWAPPTRTLVAPYLIASVLGASSFSLVPIALEYLVEVTFPASPEVGSTISWAGGQLLGGVFILAMDALREEEGDGATPEGSMWRALVFQAVLAILVVPAPLCLGVRRFGLGGEGRREGWALMRV
ncbi:hypothetical protein H2199_008704 [Coniosporium tulheliwenetii]|uniref:Uncharacterized protein n=1 Tax=Coniosporium tulheliwenetii TaxID=3383036 RepID=A0ACC2YJ39_9PEZI|nr:hypothetical protein H2199_008704 [Cladosporium sp. JES 115]